MFCQIRAGSDIAFLGGVINYAIQNNRIAHEYLVNFTNAAFLVKPDFKLPGDTDGVFSGFDAGKVTYDRSTWNYSGNGGKPQPNTPGMTTGQNHAPAPLPPMPANVDSTSPYKIPTACFNF